MNSYHYFVETLIFPSTQECGVSWPWPIAVVGMPAILPARVVAHTSAVLRHGKDT
jgi:hypothetical protein